MPPKIAKKAKTNDTASQTGHERRSTRVKKNKPPVIEISDDEDENIRVPKATTKTALKKAVPKKSVPAKKKTRSDRPVKKILDKKDTSANKKSGRIKAALNTPGIKNPYNIQFNISRLIPFMDKAPPIAPTGVDFNTLRFQSQNGEFLLVRTYQSTHQAVVRNVYNQVESVHTRALQTIHLPWGLPPDIVDMNGIELPLRFMTRHVSYLESRMKTTSEFDIGTSALEQAEPVMFVGVTKKHSRNRNHDDVKVIDFEGKAGTVKRAHLYKDPRCNPPWGIRVDKRLVQTIWNAPNASRYKPAPGKELTPDPVLEDKDQVESEEAENESEEGGAVKIKQEIYAQDEEESDSGARPFDAEADDERDRRIEAIVDAGYLLPTALSDDEEESERQPLGGRQAFMDRLETGIPFDLLETFDPYDREESPFPEEKEASKGKKRKATDAGEPTTKSKRSKTA